MRDHERAFEVLGGSVLDGYAPHGVYDRDTRDKIEIQVSTHYRHARGRPGRDIQLASGRPILGSSLSSALRTAIRPVEPVYLLVMTREHRPQSTTRYARSESGGSDV